MHDYRKFTYMHDDQSHYETQALAVAHVSIQVGIGT